MPIPSPGNNEKESDFISRCMDDKNMLEYDQKQRAAICYSKWKNHKAKSGVSELISRFVSALLNRNK